MSETARSIDNIDRALSMLKEAEKERLSQFKQSIEDDFERLASQIKGVSVDAKKRVKDFGHRMATYSRELGEDTVEAARLAAKKVDRKAHENPWPFIGVAAACGLVSGLLVAKKMRH